MPLSFPKV